MGSKLRLLIFESQHAFAVLPVFPLRIQRAEPKPELEPKPISLRPRQLRHQCYLAFDDLCQLVENEYIIFVISVEH